MALWREQRFQVIMSVDLLVELTEILQRPHIASRLDTTRQITLLSRLRHGAIWTPGTLDTSGATPDPDDDKLVSAALETGAEYIITWDSALLVQGAYNNIRIVTPEQFISIVVRS